jgi:hypothetical protein
MADDDDVERAYWRMRDTELTADVKELGRQAKAGLPGVPFDDVIAAEHLAHVIDVLEVRGNEELAPRYVEAFVKLTDAITQARQRPEMRGAMADALDDFERVEAEVLAWFASLDANGGKK